MLSILNGFIMMSSLIVAIGAQNLFVIKQGLLKNNIFYVIIICIICDITMTSIGILGLGSIISQNQIVAKLLAILGAAFLILYGINSLRSSLKGQSSLNVDVNNAGNSKLSNVIISTLAITLLNPHVYLDTFVLLGGITGILAFDQKRLFLIGTTLATISWFFCIGYGSRLLLPFFKQKKMWIILDFVIAILMFYIAINLLITIF